MKKKFRIGIIVVTMAVLTQFIPVKTFADMKDVNLLSRVDENKSASILDTLTSDGRFKVLTSTLEAAGLVDSLEGEGPFTLFAPTDNAFEKLTEKTLNELLKPENKDKLTSILTYHISPGKILSSDLIKLNGKKIKMANDKNAKIEVKDNEIFIDGAKVIVKDIMAENGVIHVIDTVMIP